MTHKEEHAPLLPPDPGRLRRSWTFVGRVLSKADEDNIFFMAGAITFNLLVVLVPLLLLFIGISGFVLTSRFPDPAAVLVEFLVGNLPTVGGEVNLVSRVRGAIDSLLADPAGFSLVGSLIFIWVSTRLVGTLRTVLREIFDFPQGRGIVRGKLFDALMVVVGGLLFVLNIGITVVIEAVEDFGANLAGLQESSLTFVRQGVGQLFAFGFIWLLFVLVYRYFPPKRIRWRTALTAATFTGVIFELTKYLFSWYMTNAANFTTVYGGLTAVAILFFWIYYGAVVFILGGHGAHENTMNRTRRLHASNGLPAS